MQLRSVRRELLLLGKPFPLNGYPLDDRSRRKTRDDAGSCGELTTRERDFVDVLLLIGRHGAWRPVLLPRQ